jgi:hypothetical protein
VPDEEAIEAREVDLGIILGNAGSWVSELSSCKASHFAMVSYEFNSSEMGGLDHARSLSQEVKDAVSEMMCLERALSDWAAKALCDHRNLTSSRYPPPPPVLLLSRLQLSVHL